MERRSEEVERFELYLSKTFNKTASLIAYTCKANAILAANAAAGRGSSAERWAWFNCLNDVRPHREGGRGLAGLGNKHTTVMIGCVNVTVTKG